MDYHQGTFIVVCFLSVWDGREQEQSNCLTKQMKNSPVMSIHDGIFHSTWNLGFFFIHSQELTRENSLPLVSQKARMTGLGKLCFRIENVLLHSIFTHSVNFLISVWGILWNKSKTPVPTLLELLPGKGDTHKSCSYTTIRATKSCIPVQDTCWNSPRRTERPPPLSPAPQTQRGPHSPGGVPAPTSSSLHEEKGTGTE